MQEPIVMSKKLESRGMSDIEIRGVISYLDEYLSDYYSDIEPTSSEDYYGFEYSGNTLNCTNDNTLPGCPEEVEGEPVSHFALSENGILFAVFFVGDEEEEIHVRMN